MQKRDAYKEISHKLAQAKALIKDCEKIAEIEDEQEAIDDYLETNDGWWTPSRNC